jgi:hypothetical protein
MKIRLHDSTDRKHCVDRSEDPNQSSAGFDSLLLPEDIWTRSVKDTEAADQTSGILRDWIGDENSIFD